jgi:hypothetical protein
VENQTAPLPSPKAFSWRNPAGVKYIVPGCNPDAVAASFKNNNNNDEMETRCKRPGDNHGLCLSRSAAVFDDLPSRPFL